MSETPTDKKRVAFILNIVGLLRSMAHLALFNEVISNLQPVLAENIDACDAKGKTIVKKSMEKLPNCEAKAILMLKFANHESD